MSLQYLFGLPTPLPLESLETRPKRIFTQHCSTGANYKPFKVCAKKKVD
jgi:hypothetical protein